MTVHSTEHNPDRYMADLRQILAQGRKRIGLLLGAGAPTSIKVNCKGEITSGEGQPLIPDVPGLTNAVLNELKGQNSKAVQKISTQIDDSGSSSDIETILSRVRQLSEAIGPAKVHGLDGPAYAKLAEKICSTIGSIVSANLPLTANPYSLLASWIGGTLRQFPVEIFTPNYDLLLEQAFERQRLPYFDGFVGAHEPFFEPTSISSDELSARWSRIWKLHGSIGWKLVGDQVVRAGGTESTELIYPEHLKYDQATRLPYSALFERLRNFLMTPDTLLLCTGFSFRDAHIAAIVDEAVASNAHVAIIALQFHRLVHESSAVSLATSRPNISVYARDGAVINTLPGPWVLGEDPSEQRTNIRQTFWRDLGVDSQGEFLLGDFAELARFLASTTADRFRLAEAGEQDTGQATDDGTTGEVQHNA